MKIIEINTIAGPLKVVTLKTFLKKVNIKRTPSKVNFIQYNQLVNFMTSPGNEEVSSYVRKYLPLSDNSVNQLKTQLLFQANFAEVWFQPITELAEEMAIHAMENLGSPKFLVKLGNNMFMVANPDDFGIWHNANGKVGLASYFSPRTKIFIMSDATEDMARNILKKSVSEMETNGDFDKQALEKLKKHVRKGKLTPFLTLK